MGFWVHSFKERTKREHEAAQRELEHQQQTIAKAALAGWRFERRPTVLSDTDVWQLWAPDGCPEGTNTSLYGAACYALQEMEWR